MIHKTHRINLELSLYAIKNEIHQLNDCATLFTLQEYEQLEAFCWQFINLADRIKNQLVRKLNGDKIEGECK